MPTEQNSPFQNKQLWFIAGIWLLICLFQAYFTELHPDEALYWMYTKELSWGYFEQPPMVALFIKLGYSLFQNELGVRLLVILTHIINLGIIYKLTKAQKPIIFALVCGSLFLIHAGSMLAVPDAPLIFFSCLFLLQLSKLKDKIQPLQALSLSVIGACMLYSKYHALVFLGILFLLLLRYRKQLLFYLIPLGALALFVPHLIWQHNHDWVSFRFHLFNRDLVDYNPVWIVYFIGGQLLLLLPLLLLSWQSGWKRSALDSFQKTMLHFSLAFFSFLLLLSLRNQVEANWSALAYAPLLIVSYKSIETLNFKKILAVTALPILCILFVRIELIAGQFKDKVNLNFKYAYYKNWALTIQEKANGRPVVFLDSYQNPSLYMFYSGDYSHSLNTSFYRGNQFDLMDWSFQFDGKTVVEVGGKKNDCHEFFTYEKDEICFRVIPDFRSYQFIWMDIGSPDKVQSTDNLDISVSIVNKNPEHEHNWSPRDNITPNLAFTWIQEKSVVLTCFPNINMSNELLDSTLKLSIPTPNKPGKYLLSCGISGVIYFPSRNSYFYTIEVD